MKTFLELARLSILLLSMILSGCASVPSEPYWKGMTRADILACAGVPQGEASDGSLHVMAYSNIWGCNLSVVLKSGVVTGVTYSGHPIKCSRTMPQLEDCEPR